MCLVCICIEEVFETRELPVVACEEGPDQRFFFFFLFLFVFRKGQKNCVFTFVFLSYFHTSIICKQCFAKSRIKTFTFHIDFN